MADGFSGTSIDGSGNFWSNGYNAGDYTLADVTSPSSGQNDTIAPVVGNGIGNPQQLANVTIAQPPSQQYSPGTWASAGALFISALQGRPAAAQNFGSPGSQNQGFAFQSGAAPITAAQQFVSPLSLPPGTVNNILPLILLVAGIVVVFTLLKKA